VGEISTPFSVKTVPFDIWHKAQLPEPENNDDVCVGRGIMFLLLSLFPGDGKIFSERSKNEIIIVIINNIIG